MYRTLLHKGITVTITMTITMRRVAYSKERGAVNPVYGCMFWRANQRITITITVTIRRAACTKEGCAVNPVYGV